MRRIIPFVVIAFTLAGCFRQADENFDTVDSQGSDGAQVPIITVAPSDVPTEATSTILDPNATTPTDVPVQVTEDNNVTPTVIIIEPSITPTPRPTEPDNVPTATTQFITPEAVVEFDEPSPTPTATSEQTFETPTAIVTDAAVPDECVHVVASGDTLYGISLSYDVWLADIYELNDMSENSVIRPGDEILIPDCGDNILPTDVPQPTEVPDETSAPTGQTIHVVVSGDTLYGIALTYGSTVNAIMEANDLSNPNSLSLGQELIIPTDDE